MRGILIALATLAALLALAAPAAADPWGPLSTHATVDTTQHLSCVGPWTTTHTVNAGPVTVTVITCDPFMGNPPW